MHAVNVPFLLDHVAWQIVIVVDGPRPSPTPCLRSSSPTRTAAVTSKPPKSRVELQKTTNPVITKEAANTGGNGADAVGLTVRIEVNLPASGDQATYDRIFRSIRENLINGNAT